MKMEIGASSSRCRLWVLKGVVVGLGRERTNVNILAHISYNDILYSSLKNKIKGDE